MSDIDRIKNKKILIKTYLSESGLWYLAKSLGDILSKNNEVFYVSKSKYKKEALGGSFRRYYPEPYDKELLSGVSCFNLSEKKAIEGQLLKIVKENKIDMIISFETFMMKGQWVSNIKSKTGIRIIDVPMPEWVNKRFVESNSYSIFDEVWCLSETSYKIFKKYKNKKQISWDYVDRGLFVPAVDKGGLERLCFYHPGPVNPGFNQKNTIQTLEAFSEFSRTSGSDAVLLVSGRLNEEEALIAKKCKNIILINDVLKREDVVKLYDKSHCIVAPSTREGLGLGFYEAKAMNCDIITVDADPMNKHSEYLCEVISYNKNETHVPFATTSSSKILEQLNRYYEDFIMSKNEVKEIEIKRKGKSQKNIDDDNEALMAAFTPDDAEQVLEELTEPLLEADNGQEDDVLEKLREKMQKKKEEDMPVVVNTRAVSIELAIIGVGQAGSRLAEVFHKKGYDVAVVNTSAQDLEFIDVPGNQKLLLEGSLGGTGKDLDLGREIFAENVDLMQPLFDRTIDGNHMVYLTVSGGGGTGSSSVDTLIPMLFETGTPVGVVYVLPKATEDAQSKKNSIETLSRLARLTADNIVSNLIVVDNARIEQIYANLSQSKFWEAANNAIVEPLHIFNTLTAKPSRFTALDPSDFGKIISCGDCSIYGVMEVDDYMEETALAEAVIDSLNSNMLASGFDLTQTRSGGVIITGSSEVLERLPAININYCFHMISEQTNGAPIYQGVYDVDSEDDSVKIYSWFAGLGLPRDRIENLKKESQQQAAIASQKEKNRDVAMTLDLGEDKVNAVSEEVNRKIQKKKSGFNRLQRGSRGGKSSIIDRRRRK
jgi:cell division GTPase FtsZ/glycosyltransferase involved in cell wall biosynthesis